MKKKGLIISTVVMVVVLIASLTTATYAWFTTSNQTSINGFNIEVAPGSAVVVGFKQDLVLAASGAVNNDMFVSGNVEYNTLEAANKWSGDAAGLTTSLTPIFHIGKLVDSKYVMETAVAKTTATTIDNTNVTKGNTYYWAENWTSLGISEPTNVVVANNAAGDALTNVASANVNSDYAHFILGAQATKALTSLTFAITITSSGKTTLGMAAATHIAYRTTKDGEWKDVDVFGSKTANTKVTDVVAYDLTGTSGEDAIHKEAGSATEYITLNIDPAVINQIEIVIYLAGKDPDCIDSAKGAVSQISMDFIAVEAE